MDIRQWPHHGDYLAKLGWKIENVSGRQIFIRPIPFLHCSAIKIQRPKNPLPFAEIDKLAYKYRALFVIIEPDLEGFNSQEIQNHGYEPSQLSFAHTSTVLLDLNQSQKELLSSFSENARRNIKKAQKNNLEVKIINLKNTPSDADFKQFFKLLTNLTKIKKFYIPGYDEFYKRMIAFKDSSTLLFAHQKNNPLPIAVVWLGHFKETAVYMQTGITEDGYKTLANYLLVWEALKYAQSMGCKLFDFEGIFDPRFPKERKKWIHFSEFKKRFHGQIMEYPGPWIKCYNPVFKLFYLCSKILPK